MRARSSQTPGPRAAPHVVRSSRTGHGIAPSARPRSTAAVDAARVRAKWQIAGAGERYARERWRSRRRRGRDPEVVAALLAEHLGARPDALLLDAPCGAGRLAPALARFGRGVGLDVSRAM